MLFSVYAMTFVLGLFAAAVGVRITFQLTPDLWERRPALRCLPRSRVPRVSRHVYRPPLPRRHDGRFVTDHRDGLLSGG